MSDILDETKEVVKIHDLFAVLDSNVVGQEEVQGVVQYGTATDLVSAESLMAAIKVETLDIQRLKALRTAVNDRIKNMIAEGDGKIENAKACLQPFVEKIVKENLKIDAKAKKSINFMSGVAGMKKSQGSVQIDDMRKAADKCEKMGIPVTKTVSKNDLKKLYKELPDAFKQIDGVKFIKAGPDYFYVTA